MTKDAAPSAHEFEAVLLAILGKATREGAATVEIKSGDVHRTVGGYPGPNHRMPVCCAAMRSAMNSNDTVVAQPPKGNGASLLVRYSLPR